MGTYVIPPADLGIDDVSLKVTTSNTSNIFDVSRAYTFTAIVDITETGTPAAGAASLVANVMDGIGSSASIIYSVDLLTGIDIQTNGDQNVVTFGAGVNGAKTGSGTIGTAIDVLKAVEFLQLDLIATTASDGTTCTGDVTLIVEQL
jgi:hypothetical protein